jgi:hypothetical protein
MPSEAEILAERLSRMKALIDSLESACAVSSANREQFAKLRAELDAARTALKPLTPGGSRVPRA